MMSQRSGKDEPWTYAEGPPCLDSIVAASSIAPEERATFTVWADETSWHNPARDGKVEVKSVDGSSVARTQRNARRRMFAMLILAALGIAALVLLVLGFSKKSATQSQSTAPPASSSTSLNQPMPTAAVATTTAPPAGILDTPGALIFINKCTTEFDVYYTINMPHDMSEVSQRALNSSTLAMVVPGANWTDYIAADFRLGNSTASSPRTATMTIFTTPCQPAVASMCPYLPSLSMPFESDVQQFCALTGAVNAIGPSPRTAVGSNRSRLLSVHSVVIVPVSLLC
ncbi:hypothetical protein Ae201684P_011131 [Aphanomyces euteiches]|nr:hypothetical protein Ae201684P_011131 [Aphanomyces euteiches]